ncbi:hypothetical protein JOD27_008527 [Lentzea nigeriaca]|nr:hypothetical protein [Lentzea nigeriaca]
MTETPMDRLRRDVHEGEPYRLQTELVKLQE